MKRLFLLTTTLLSILTSLHGQSVLTLDSCRSLALANNKELLIGNEKVTAAHYQRKAAFTNYFPKISATGIYMRNSQEFSLLSNDQKAAIGGLGTGVNGSLQQAGQALGQINPALAQQLGPLLGILGNNIEAKLNQTGESLIDALRTDTRNMYGGAITVTQPLYMGGKIRAYNKITRYAEEIARQQHAGGMQEVIMTTDQVYWQVVSLSHKYRLATSYHDLLVKLDNDMQKLVAEGVATKADGLSVRVKLNEAEMTLTKVEDGLSLSRMLLCQLCGLDLSTPIALSDEKCESLEPAVVSSEFNIDQAYANRPELRSLELATEIYRQKINITRSEFLPNLALTGNYLISNPSVFNSFENKFKGMWNVGVMLRIPILNWGECFYKVKSSKAESRIANYQLQDAREKIELQVNQASFKVDEANKKLLMTEKNQEKAEENLRFANLGFEEGVIGSNQVLEAQTAWLKARSEKIDAQIDVKLTEIYLKKSLGNLYR